MLEQSAVSFDAGLEILADDCGDCEGMNPIQKSMVLIMTGMREGHSFNEAVAMASLMTGVSEITIRTFIQQSESL